MNRVRRQSASQVLFAAGWLVSFICFRSVMAAPSQGAPQARIVDVHVHFDEKNPDFIPQLLAVSRQLNLTACVLTPYRDRQIVANAARQHPSRIVPFGYVDLDDPHAVQQVKDFHALGYRGLGELEFVQHPYISPDYMPVYKLANQYGWVVLFHTGIVLRAHFHQPENVASYRMRAFYLEEIARRFPRITVIGAHCGNPEYEWAAEVARWNPNVFFDLSGTTLTKMAGRLNDFRKIFWWSGPGEGIAPTDSNANAFAKLVFGSDTTYTNSAQGFKEIQGVNRQYHDMFNACQVPEPTQRLIMGETLVRILNLSPLNP